ncbi:cell division transport system ATP-binding protein [Roseivirga ehrenbergii]|jgi:cell division transport system ATP-binding protein|uniref:Cell division ATP-binding protein FtsE n=2 Tax=Roseivirga TaxID=290180 RepID=A0A150WXT1_ROSEK|nr:MULTISPECIES: ATP-binding cassette domain-containing protein [Roseivirga]KYG71301.1 phosphonate ABC transporter ATP-binding protein [Roseivirga ehrenbergii]KYG85186.1 phosphonate ABC transporter ATP-binding protein [Roseivirga seohaensis]TCK99659.1 cell division transport system ATP-binding protein [Roseivirga ehrenbergii]|tara:strand:- start:57580 stop:58290 length:711 start_codon:yes stop_codon:yes gene_type:complete
MPFSGEPIVRIEDATIFQDDKTVLNNITLSINKGELVYLVGRTGSGKSSLLKTLYADLPLRLGKIRIANHDIQNIKRKDVPLLRRKLGVVFQDFQLFPDRSVAENIYFVMKATGWKNKAKMKSKLAEVLMRVGLGVVANKMPHQLSGGEQQRVVIARALINDPVLLIADEPTGNLDPEVSDGIFQTFMEINKGGTSILMATHDYNLIKNYPKRVLKCEKGSILDSNEVELSLFKVS